MANQDHETGDGGGGVGKHRGVSAGAAWGWCVAGCLTWWWAVAWSAERFAGF